MTIYCLCGGVAQVNKCGTYSYDGKLIMDQWFSIECQACGLGIGSNSRRYRSADEVKTEWGKVVKKIEKRLFEARR